MNKIHPTSFQSRADKSKNDMQSQRVSNKSNESGFSVIEVVVVMTVILIMTAASLFYMNNQGRLFKADDEALQIVDVFQEARQRSLTQRETMRVEIDLSDGKARLIDENEVSSANDDVLLKEVNLFPSTEVRLDARPSNIDHSPPEPLASAPANFRTSVHPLSALNNVCTFRFLNTGRVVNSGETATGSNAQLKSETLFIWSPKKDDQDEFEVARAISVVGTTGAIRLWEYAPGSTESNKWQDSRRVSSYGGQSQGNTNSLY